MVFFAACTLLLVPQLVAAQVYGGGGGGGGGGAATTATTAPASAPSAPANTDGQINVDVAFNNNFVFHPNNFTATKGTLVTFWFPNNGITHSVTQSSMANPCTRLAATGNSPAGFDSGLTAATKFTINITDDTQPIYIHCKQLLHCGMGMVAAINAPNFNDFLSTAQKIGNSETTENGSEVVTGGVNAVATAGPVSSTGTTSNNNNGVAGLSGFPPVLLGLTLLLGTYLSYL